MSITQRVTNRVPEPTLRAVMAGLAPLARPRSLRAVWRLTLACARAAWVCAREASRCDR